MPDCCLTFLQNNNLITARCSYNHERRQTHYINASSECAWVLKTGEFEIQLANLEITRKNRIIATGQKWCIEGRVDGDALEFDLFSFNDPSKPEKTLKGSFVDKHRTVARGEDWELVLTHSLPHMKERLVLPNEKVISFKIDDQKAFICLFNKDTKEERLKVIPLTQDAPRVSLNRREWKEDPIVLHKKPTPRLHKMDEKYAYDGEIAFNLENLDGMSYFVPSTEDSSA